ncbi:MAG: hypothetical protein K8T25_00690 [Planctomycetia bacterium]|nr:hypothetical protein [Planctomycetia bacterium]
MSIVPIHRRGANVAAEGAAPKHRRRDAAEPSNRRRQVPILLRLPDLTDEAEPFASATRDKATPDRDTPDWATVEPDDISHSGAAADHAPLRDANIDPPTIDDSEFDEIDSDSASGPLTSRATPASSQPSFAPVRVDRPGRTWLRRLSPSGRSSSPAAG